MFWLRWVVFSSPLWLILGGVWLFGKVAELQLAHDSDALVYAISEPIGFLSPLGPSSGVTGEVADLIFEPLLRRDADLELQPNLIERWTTRTVVTLRCESEEAAGEAEARMRAGEVLKKGPQPIALERDGSILSVAFDGAEGEPERALIEGLPAELLANYRLIKVYADHSVKELIEAWMAGSIEKAQLRMLDYEGDREANLFVEGKMDRFLAELRLYLESNPATHPRLEVLGERCDTVARELVLDLKKGVAWHDGAPLTARDLAFSFEVLTQPDSPLPLAANFDYVDGIEIISEHRLRVRCHEVFAMAWQRWESLPLLPEHLFSGVQDLAGTLAEYSLHPIGLGAYQLKERTPDGGAELVANESYHRGSPSEKHLRYRRFASFEAILLAIRRGTLNLIEPDARFTEWAQRNPGIVTSLRDRARFQHLVVWNLERPPFQSEKIRTALAQTIDLKAILQDSTTEFEQPVQSLYRPGLPFVTKQTLPPLYDPKRAELLLEEGGYRRDPESGKLVKESGEVLAFSLAVNEANPRHRRVAQALVEQWAALGISVELELLPWSALLLERLPQRDFDAVIVSWELPTAPDQSELWHSVNAGRGGGNLSGLHDKTVDQILESIRTSSDHAELVEWVMFLQDELMRLQPCLFLCDSGRILTIREGTLEMQRPDGQGAYQVPEAIAIGKAGLEELRPWWKRRALLDP